MVKRISLIALLVALVPAHAFAIPGQTTAQFLAWTKQNIPSHVLRKSPDDMSGRPIYSAVFHLGGPNGHDVFFSGEPGVDGMVHAETLAVQGVGNMDQYDIRQHKKLAMSMLSWLYGANIAIDFGEAKLLADYKMKNEPTHMAIYRGKLFGYQLSGIAVEVMLLKELDASLAEAKRCSLGPCGD